MEFGPYRIVKRLAAGGMGEVFLATLERVGGFQKEVAVKSIHPKYMTNPRFVEFFEREARLAALLNHRHIVQIFDFGRDESRVWLAMEYVDGVDLKTVMTTIDEPLPLRLTLDIVQACAQALDYAHRAKDGRGKRLEIVHRDISPQNILLSFEGDVKVADFGLAHAAALGPDQDRSLKGKYAYMSPEQVMGSAVDARTDQFSLGTVLYEMLSGERAFHDKAGPSEMLMKVHRGIPGEGFDALRQTVPGVVVDVLERTLKTNRTERYPDLGAMVDDLRNAVRSLANEAPPMDLSAWLRALFPNREVLVSATSVESTRTALAEEPIAERPKADAGYVNDSSERLALGLATTGPHKAAHHDLRFLEKKEAETTTAQAAPPKSPLSMPRALLVILMSAFLTLSMLSLWFYDDEGTVATSGRGGVEESEVKALSVVVSEQPQMIDAGLIRDVAQTPTVLDDPATGSDASTVVLVPKPTLSAPPPKSKKTALKKKVVKPLARPQKPKSPSIITNRQKNSVKPAASIENTTSKPVPKPKTAAQVPDAQIAKVAPVVTPDAGIAEKKPIPPKPPAPMPQIRLRTSGLFFSTTAPKLGPNRFAIGKAGALLSTRSKGILVMLRFQAPRGRFLMTVQTRPPTNVFLNGRGLGGTPLASFPLGSGGQVIEVKTEAGVSVRIPISLSR